MLRAIVILFLSLMTASGAQAVGVSSFLRNLYNDSSYVVGGGLSCGVGQPPTTLTDLRAVDCVTHSNYVGTPTNQTPYLQYAEDLVLYDLAANAEASANCNLPMFDDYVKGGASVATMNHAAFLEFQGVREKIKNTVDAVYSRRQQLDTDISQRCGLPPSSICADTVKTSASGDFAKLNEYLSALTSSVSLGSAPAMKSALVDLALKKSVSEADFAKAYAPEVKSLDSNLHEFLKDVARAKTTFKDQRSVYDFREAPSVREKLITSPEYDLVLTKLGASSSVRQKLICRRDAEFHDGPERVRMAELGITILSMGLGVGEVALVARAGEGTKAVVDASRSVRMLAQGFIAGADVAMAGADLGRQCLDTPTPVGTDGKCSVHQATAGKIAEASKAQCGISVLEAGLAVIPLGKMLKMDRVKQAAEERAFQTNRRAALEAEYDKERIVEGSATRIAKPPMAEESLAAPLNPRPLSASLTTYEKQAALAPYTKTFGVTVAQVKQFKASLLENAAPADREKLVQIFNKMVDRDEWSKYMEQVARDARTLSRRQLLNRQSIARLLTKRAEERGEKTLRTLEAGVADDKSFADAIRHGFFDKAAANIRITDKTTGLQTRVHGMDTHLIQRDFIAATVEKTWPGGSKAFYEYLAKDKAGLKLYDTIFDKPGAENATDPSYLLELMAQGGLPVE